MLENLINLVREQAGDTIINNPAIPNEQNEAVVAETGNTIMNSLQRSLAGGNLKDVLKIFSGRTEESNPVVQHATQDLTQQLSGKFGVPAGQAAGIAGSLIPNILSQLASRTADPNQKGFDLQNIFNQLSGGKTSGINMGGILNQFKGSLDRDGDGDVDLSDLAGMFTGGGGGLMDKVKGMFS